MASLIGQAVGGPSGIPFGHASTPFMQPRPTAAAVEAMHVSGTSWTEKNALNSSAGSPYHSSPYSTLGDMNPYNVTMSHTTPVQPIKPVSAMLPTNQMQPKGPGVVSPGTGRRYAEVVKHPPALGATMADAVAARRHVGEGGLYGKGGIGGPGLLATAIGAGVMGYQAGNQDASSFAMGAGGGMVGGTLLTAAADFAHKSVGGHVIADAAKPMAERMGPAAMKAMKMGQMMTHAGGRQMLFAGGALLSGAMFSSMFASNSKSYASGMNADRGNQIRR